MMINPIYFGAEPIVKVNLQEDFKSDLEYIKTLSFRTQKDGLHITEEDNILELLELSNLRVIVLKAFREYQDKILEVDNDFYISQSWATINRKTSYHGRHHHPNCLFSLVYYLQAENTGLNFMIKNSALQNSFNFHYKIKNHNYYNSTSWEVPVTTGDMLIFPGHLEHFSSANKNDSDRIILGVNFFIKGEIGTKEDYSRITI